MAAHFPVGYASAMLGDFFSTQRAKIAAGMAVEVGCNPAAFDLETLTIVPRPEPPAWHYTAMVCTFGTGTAVSVESSYLDWARENAPKQHFHAFHESFLGALLADGALRGERFMFRTGGLGFGLSRAPGVEDQPGFRFERMDTGWMNAQRRSGVFHNALGEPDDEDRGSMYRFAIAAYTADGQLAALSGVNASSGLYEIHVDVVRAFRGSGLSNAVVSRAISAILERGETPFYSCGVTNIRSQRTALANGFLPVCSMGFVGLREE